MAFTRPRSHEGPVGWNWLRASERRLAVACGVVAAAVGGGGYAAVRATEGSTTSPVPQGPVSVDAQLVGAKVIQCHGVTPDDPANKTLVEEQVKITVQNKSPWLQSPYMNFVSSNPGGHEYWDGFAVARVDPRDPCTNPFWDNISPVGDLLPGAKESFTIDYAIHPTGPPGTGQAWVTDATGASKIPAPGSVSTWHEVYPKPFGVGLH